MTKIVTVCVMDVTKLIKDLGGVTEVARMLGEKVTTVQYWFYENRLPAWRQSVLDRLQTEHRNRKAAEAPSGKRRRKAAA